MNIVFFGTPDFVIPVCESLRTNSRTNLVSIVTRPDRPVGRKQIPTPSPVKQWAQEHKIPVLTPEILDDNFIKELRIMNYELGVLASYGRIIPRSIIELFPKGIIVIHPSLLPKYRGPIPIPAAILCGEKETGSTFILMDEKMDHGPILYQFKSEIKPDDTAGTLLYRIWKESAEKLPDVLSEYLAGKITPQTQDETKATYTKLFQKEDGFIPWECLKKAMEVKEIKSYRGTEWKINFLKNSSLSPNPASLERFIRSMTPWPGAWTLLRPSTTLGASEGQAKRLKVLKTHVENDKLVLDEVQLEGKKPTSWKQFQQAYLRS